MAKINIPTGSSTFVADQADTTYILKFGSSINTSMSMAVDATAAAENRTFQIDGSIVGSTSGIVVGYYNDPKANNHVTIGETGVVDADKYGVTVYSDGGSIVNDGVVRTTDSDGYGMGGEATGMLLENNGTLSAYTGFSLLGTGGKIVNSGTVMADQYGVMFNTADGANNTLSNSGTIAAAGGHAVYGVAGDEKIINSGLMVGQVTLGEGDDTYISRGGRLQGVVYGGDGNDTYVIDQASTKITENASEGFDRLRSSVSIKLADYIEEARLTGKSNINLTGTGQVDLLYGNNGDNWIKGGLGADFITGGRGNDRLSGGDMGDHFVFKGHSGDDVITDFQDGMDDINLGGYDGIDGFSDLTRKQVGDDMIISLLDGDSITVRNIDKANLSALDFDF